MDRKFCSKADEKFVVYPSDFNVIIRQIKPLYVFGTRPIIIDCRREGCPDFKSFMKIKVKPKHGIVYVIEPSILIYKARECFCGIDMFQIFFRDEASGTHVESIFIHVK
ncbi:MAG TPA: hypothetical protein VIK26_09290 [Clostridium sp.]